jgi:hypothetical protein
MMEEEWGPWIEHDGKGCPCVGKIVHVALRDGRLVCAVAGAETIARGNDPSGPYSAWVWIERRQDFQKAWEIIRYRIRKPKALRELIDMVERLPVREDA